MATRIVLASNLAGTENNEVVVREDFDTVANQVAPVTAISSQMEYRTNAMFTLDEDGSRAYIPANCVLMFFEVR